MLPWKRENTPSKYTISIYKTGNPALVDEPYIP
jgi:hypothetical protein